MRDKKLAFRKINQFNKETLINEIFIRHSGMTRETIVLNLAEGHS